MEKLGQIIYDGRIIDLDKAPLEELIKIQEELTQKEEAKIKDIEKFLEDDEDNEAELDDEER